MNEDQWAAAHQNDPDLMDLPMATLLALAEAGRAAALGAPVAVLAPLCEQARAALEGANDDETGTAVLNHLMADGHALEISPVDAKVIRDPGITPLATALYALLATFAPSNRGGPVEVVFPSRQAMAMALCTGVESIDRALAELRGHGVIS